ncbi:MAG: sigma-70 family RNA polymerase sigma factor [Acidobacteriota bacterium]|nr:sigma-70 family RNA polymerase sigma factor [Acidobacteriota bacterium]
MNLILLSFLQANEESERERLLSELILVHASPLIRHTLRQRLGFFVNHAGTNPNNPEAEDLYHDVITRLIAKLHELRTNSGKDTISNFRQYVASVAANACHDYLRAKSPARSRLKNNLRDLLDHHSDFSLWKDDVNEYLCGFAAWRNRELSQAASKNLRRLQEMPGEFKIEVLQRQDVRRVPLMGVVAEIFNRVEGPVKLESLVEILAVLLEVKDHPVESLDSHDTYPDRRFTDSTFGCETRVELREILRQLWEEIRRLPPKQRDAFCLSFADENGDDLFSLLINAEVVTLPRLAEELGLTHERLLTLWKVLPMGNEALAAELGATRAQINKWRHRALRQLRKMIMASAIG